MAGNIKDTTAEYLRDILTQITQAKQAKDANQPMLEFLIGLETSILAKLREPIDAMMQDPETGLGGMAGMPSPDNPMGLTPGAGGPGGMAGAAGPMVGAPMGGLSTRASGPMRPAPPNPDELRRMISGPNVQGG